MNPQRLAKPLGTQLIIFTPYLNGEINFLLQDRDAIYEILELHEQERLIANDGVYSVFGGLLEPDETPKAGAYREMLEELNIDLYHPKLYGVGDIWNYGITIEPTFRAKNIEGALHFSSIDTIYNFLVGVYDLERFNSKVVVGEGRGAEWMSLSEIEALDINLTHFPRDYELRMISPTLKDLFRYAHKDLTDYLL